MLGIETGNIPLPYLYTIIGLAKVKPTTKELRVGSISGVSAGAGYKAK
jgi:hypothetical protein